MINLIEFLGGILSCKFQDGLWFSWMLLKILGNIEHITLNNNPNIIRCMMFGHLSHGKFSHKNLLLFIYNFWYIWWVIIYLCLTMRKWRIRNLWKILIIRRYKNLSLLLMMFISLAKGIGQRKLKIWVSLKINKIILYKKRKSN